MKEHSVCVWSWRTVDSCPPSPACKDVLARRARPIRAELDLPENVQLISGQEKSELGHLEGRSNRLSVSTMNAASPTDNRAWREWILRGEIGTEIQVHVCSDRAGSLHETVVLE